MDTYLKLKKSNCQNCYKCIRHCPVKSIKFSDNQAHIVSDECILCGQCFVVCPQNAKEVADSKQKVREIISQNQKIIASVAPSFIANFKKVGIDNLAVALKKLGFTDVEETAIGATIVKKEYENLLATNQYNVLISSCCPSVNLLIQKYYPGALKYLAPVMTPMEAHAKFIKEKNPDAKVVFIGPCISKKYEANEVATHVDSVLTFEELFEMFKENKITLEFGVDEREETRARFFPIPSGIIKTMDLDQEKYSYLSFDGINNCVEALKDVIEGNIENCFIEMSSCRGGCVAGPATSKRKHSPISDNMAVISYAGKKDFPVGKVEVSTTYPFIGTNRTMPGNAEIEAILKKMGKHSPADELNCGACGYNTCRDKAVAIHFGKADLSMCLPFLKDKAESFSDIITKNSPNGIIVLSDNLEIQQISPSARKIMGIKNSASLIGEQVIRILDPKPFIDVMESGKSIRNERTYLSEYSKYVELSIVFDRSYNMLMCIMRDVNDEENQKKKKEQIALHTVEVTNKVIEKQMRVVQEIASLLGETTAETKIALTKLKDSLGDE